MDLGREGKTQALSVEKMVESQAITKPRKAKRAPSLWKLLWAACGVSQGLQSQNFIRR
jgi:hypothetical protein